MGNAGRLLEVRDLAKTYRGGVTALAGVSLGVDRGEVVGLLGPNGAGKSTLVRCVLGLCRPSAGSVLLDGQDLETDPRRARSVCSYQPQAAPPLVGMRVHDAMGLAAEMRGASRVNARDRATELVQRFGLGEWAHRSVDSTSGGVRRLLGFCMAIAVPGRLVVLDEPTNDVDPRRRRAMWAQVRELADDDRGVVLVTHNVQEAETVVDRVVVLARGRVGGDAAPPGLEASYLALVPELAGWAGG